MFYMNQKIKQFYYSLIAFVLIAAGFAVFIGRVTGETLPEDRRYLPQSVRHTVMGSIYDRNGTLIGSGSDIGAENWEPTYSVSFGNLIGPSVLLTRVNSIYSRVYFGDILYGQKADHLTASDLVDFTDVRTGGLVTLTIDAELQNYVYDYLAARYDDASAAVINYKTGEILALVSVPSYDLSYEASLHLSEDADGTLVIDDIRAVNKAINELNMPGSSIKPLIYTAALEYDPSLLSKKFTCTGSYTNAAGITVSCPGHRAHGVLGDMTSALAVSCNGYAEHIYEEITKTAEGRAILSRILHEFGFDRAYRYTGLRFADGVFSGIDPSPEMNAYSVIGGGQCRITTFGLAAAYSAIANHGSMMEPHLLKSWQADTRSEVVETNLRESRTICSKETASTVLDMMQGVTKFGTGQTMALEGFKVASKTGTAVHDNSDKETLWATAILDSEEFPYVVAVMIDETDPSFQNSSNTAGVAVHSILEYLTTH